VTSVTSWSLKYLNYEFSELAHLELALTHKSRSAANNERLEFLGDAVLGFVIAAELYQQEPSAAEGTLSRLRSTLVRGETLAQIAAETRLGDRLRLGSGEARSGGHHRESMMADGVEAVLGAVYIDGGYEAARTVILHLFANRLADLPGDEELKDPKTLLQEYLQSHAFELPVYTVLTEEGPPHARQFTVSCDIPKLSLNADGTGSSRRKAEQVAATLVMQKLPPE
jgi:ribonuclease-3